MAVSDKTIAYLNHMGLLSWFCCFAYLFNRLLIVFHKTSLSFFSFIYFSVWRLLSISKLMLGTFVLDAATPITWKRNQWYWHFYFRIVQKLVFKNIISGKRDSYWDEALLCKGACRLILNFFMIFVCAVTSKIGWCL